MSLLPRDQGRAAIPRLQEVFLRLRYLTRARGLFLTPLIMVKGKTVLWMHSIEPLPGRDLPFRVLLIPR